MWLFLVRKEGKREKSVYETRTKGDNEEDGFVSVRRALGMGGPLVLLLVLLDFYFILFYFFCRTLIFTGTFTTPTFLKYLIYKIYIFYTVILNLGALGG